MVRRVLARSYGRDITADFESDEEYRRFCKAVVEECISAFMQSITLDDAVKLWKEKNGKSE